MKRINTGYTTTYAHSFQKRDLPAAGGIRSACILYGRHKEGKHSPCPAKNGNVLSKFPLFQNKKADSPECRCGFHNETVSHFIFTCPYYSDQRNVMFDRLSHTLSIDLRSKNQKHQLNTLLHGTDISDGDGLAVALNLQDFLLSSKRFSHL